MLLPERVLVETTTPMLIQELQDKGFKVLALTSCPTGKFGYVPQVEQWRIDHLKTLNIDFSPAFDIQIPLWLTEIAKNGSPSPLFEKGILFSKGYSKGEVLMAFLEKIQKKPSKVIFIDDLEENLLSVEEYLNLLNIPFVGYLYLGARLPQEKIDADLIQFQFNHLLETNQWLSDDEIIQKERSLLNNKWAPSIY